MPEIRKKYDREFREGAVRIVEETGKPIAQVARDLGVKEGTLGNWVARARAARNGTEGLSTGDIEELKRLWLTRPVGASAPARVNPGPTGAR
jgi:transposase